MSLLKKKKLTGPEMNVAKKIRPISEKKRNDIITEAGKLFLKHGFGAISMDEISQKAKVSKRTLYNHFPNKKELFTEIIKLEWQKIRYPQVCNFNGDTPNTTDDPEVMFTKIMKHIMETMYSKRMQDIIKLVISEAERFPELKSLQAKYGMDPQFKEFVNYIKYLSRAGILEVDNPILAAAQYIGLVKECIFWPVFLGLIPKPTEDQQDEVIQRANKIFFDHYRKK